MAESRLEKIKVVASFWDSVPQGFYRNMHFMMNWHPTFESSPLLVTWFC